MKNGILKNIYIYKRYFSISNNFYNNPSFVIKKTSTSMREKQILTLRKTWCWRFGWGVFFHCASIKRKLIFFHCVNVEHDFSIFEIVFHILVFCKWKKKMYEIKKGICMYIINLLTFTFYDQFIFYTFFTGMWWGF